MALWRLGSECLMVWSRALSVCSSIFGLLIYCRFAYLSIVGLPIYCRFAYLSWAVWSLVNASTSLYHPPSQATAPFPSQAPALHAHSSKNPALHPQTIASIWMRVLGVPLVGMNVPFIEYGGDSLSAVSVISQVPHKQSPDLLKWHPVSQISHCPTLGCKLSPPASLASTKLAAKEEVALHLRKQTR